MRDSNLRVKILFAFAALLCLLRFVDLGSAPFINDEPQLQLLMDYHLQHHSVPLLGLMGTHGVNYGPTALWFYYPIRLVTDQINWIVAYFAAISVIGYALLVRAVWKTGGAEKAAWVAAFAAASPYLFFYSRLPWDNPFLLPLIAGVCLCVVRIDQKVDLLSWVFLGLLGGLIVNLHLMAVPVLVAAMLALAPTLIARLRVRESRTAVVKGMALAAIFFVAVVAPYVSQIWGSLSGGGQFDPKLPHIGAGIQDTPRYFSWNSMQYFIEGPKDFRTLVFGDEWLAKLFHFEPSSALKIAGWAFLPLIVWRWMRRPKTVTVLERMALLSFVLLLLYYGGLTLELSHPHYMLPIWWVMMFLAASAIVESRGWLKVILASAGILTLAMNLTFIDFAHAWIARYHGTRGVHYAPVHSELENAVSGICRDVASKHALEEGPVPVWLDASGVIGIFPFSIQYDFVHQPDCAGRVIPILADQPISRLQRYRLDYRDAGELSAALTWRKFQ
jgi:hypothetical protein